MQNEMEIQTALKIEKDQTYVIEINHPRSENDIKHLIKTFQEQTGAKAIILVGAKIARATDG